MYEAQKGSHSPIKAQERSGPRNQSSVGSKTGACVNQSMCVLFSPCPFFHWVFGMEFSARCTCIGCKGHSLQPRAGM
jgi:hypothetical protein